MTVALVIALVIIGLVLFLKFFGGESATKRTMYASYYARREKMGPSASEREVLAGTLRARPPFSKYTDDMISDILDMCPDIESLTAFVIGFDKRGRG